MCFQFFFSLFFLYSLFCQASPLSITLVFFLLNVLSQCASIKLKFSSSNSPILFFAYSTLTFSCLSHLLRSSKNAIQTILSGSSLKLFVALSWFALLTHFISTDFHISYMRITKSSNKSTIHNSWSLHIISISSGWLLCIPQGITLSVLSPRFRILIIHSSIALISDSICSSLLFTTSLVLP